MNTLTARFAGLTLGLMCNSVIGIGVAQAASVSGLLPTMSPPILGLAPAPSGRDLVGGSLLSNFDLLINLDFSGSTLTPMEEAQVTAAYANAETLYETNILGYQVDDAILQGVTIDASVPLIDGPGGILGQAGPTFIYNPAFLPPASPIYTFSGIMQFDSADVSNLIANGSFVDVVLHEMAHVLGFGTLWTVNGLYVNGSGEYTGANALAKYREEFDPFATFVPVELDGGPGTANGHWDENWAGGPNELMTGFLDLPTTVSDTTLYAFRDLGYTTVDTLVAPVPLPPALLGLAAGLAALGGLRSRQRRTG
jgi:hypothetical protein